MKRPPLFSRLRQHWLRLPRDSRDTLFLLAVIAWTLAPHVTNLPLWCTALTGVVLAWRATLAWRHAPLPSRPVLVAVLALSLALTFVSHRGLVGRDAGVTLLVVLTALKTLELRARRDAFVIFFLGFFLILTQFVHSQSLPVALMMVGSVWGLLTGLVLAHMPVGQPALKRAAGLAARTALLGAPVMVLLFLLFPRFGPLWGQPDDGAGRTGLSNRLKLGDVSELAQDDSIAMRVRFPDGQAPDPKLMYFRGPVLSVFDGQEWTAPDPRSLSGQTLQLRTRGTPLRYEVTLEPSRLHTVPMLEATPSVPRITGGASDLRLTPGIDLIWQASRPVTERLQLQGEAFTAFAHGPTTAEPELTRYLAVPPQSNPRTQAWASGIRRDPRYAQADARTLALALMQHIRGGGYTYTLQPGAYGADAVDEFWLDRKRGFCEHYAASFVIVLRTLGVPARIVTGYQGAEHNPLDDTWVVRQRFAHAWVEYWQPGSGWLRADPTTAVAPDRIERGVPLAPVPGVMARTVSRFDPALVQQVRAAWDAANHRWNQWVLNYSSGTQTSLLQRLGFETIDWSILVKILLGVLVAASLAGAAWAAWDQHRQDPWLRAWARVRRAAREAGFDVTDAMPPHTLALSLSRQLGRPLPTGMSSAFDSFSALRYGRPDHGPTTLGSSTRRARRLARELARSIGPLAAHGRRVPKP